MKEFGGVDLVIEVVFEEMSLKKQVFVEFLVVCKLEVFLCINILVLDVDEIVFFIDCFYLVIGIYFFLLVYVMKLLEVIFS